ncbi:predicted protein [Nematostella vectensis]|uniref:DUF885 domain-containing protein n=1 Tax=Nematostella vectensis TaxID=45351 RepID=A7SY04_NEMVE|nr:predicted protein [Nematostella vectensis]|eukprot:XP_001623512.1 predicted protein [Nematostella vectensis]
MSQVALHKENGEDKIEMIQAPTLSFTDTSRPRWLVPLVILACIAIITGLALIIVGAVRKPECAGPKGSSTGEDSREECRFSEEAKRAGLQEFLKKAQSKYYEMNPDNVAWQPEVPDRRKHLKERYFPYNPDPKQLKKKTDAALALLSEVNNMGIDVNGLKPREAKALAQVKHFLKHTFGVPYAENYYAGDWLLGPDLFCWQAICTVSYDVNALASHVTPRTYEDVDYLVDMIMKHKTVVDQYRSNVVLGVKSGMVRTKIDCVAGVDALKERYRVLSLANNSKGVLDDWYTANFKRPEYYSELEEGVNDKWTKNHKGMNVSDSILDALVKGLGQPLLDLINYLEGDHMRHCLPNDFRSGLGGLPVDYVYYDGVPDKKQPTNKKLPTGEPLNGTQTYRMILSYFTTTDISPEEIYEEGKKQLDSFYSEVLNITIMYTGKSNERDSVKEFKAVLNSANMWHNNGSFPKNESDENAYKKCVSPASAAKYCPVRWAAIQRWAKFCRQVMGMLYPKITDLFYFTGAKITAPNCPVEMLPHYNPSNGAQFFKESKTCAQPSYFGLPFFLKDYGPIFQEWSVTAHEARPGHHTQIQSVNEHFQDTCGGVPGWLDSETYYTAFTEGWGLYSENPLISDDTDTYKDNMLQRYGMLKWQVWRAVRLIVDTGLHYRGISRSDALKMFEDYAWDKSDFAVKEVTRYQSDPGQATAYMLGRLELIKMRKKAEKALGSKFNLKDFHYQVLKQGSAPLAFLKSHIDRYIMCVKGELGESACRYILPGQKNSQQEKKKQEDLAPRPPKIHYV